MQKLKIVNCLGESIEFGMHAPFLLSHIEGLGIPTVEVYETQAVGMDGSEAHDILLADRLILSRITIVCDTREELYAKRRQIIRLLNPKLYNPITKKRGKLTLYYTNQHQFQMHYLSVSSLSFLREYIRFFLQLVSEELFVLLPPELYLLF